MQKSAVSKLLNQNESSFKELENKMRAKVRTKKELLKVQIQIAKMIQKWGKFGIFKRSALVTNPEYLALSPEDGNKTSNLGVTNKLFDTLLEQKILEKVSVNNAALPVYKVVDQEKLKSFIDSSEEHWKNWVEIEKEKKVTSKLPRTTSTTNARLKSIETILNAIAKELGVKYE